MSDFATNQDQPEWLRARLGLLEAEIRQLLSSDWHCPHCRNGGTPGSESMHDALCPGDEALAPRRRLRELMEP